MSWFKIIFSIIFFLMMSLLNRVRAKIFYPASIPFLLLTGFNILNKNYHWYVIPEPYKQISLYAFSTLFLFSLYFIGRTIVDIYKYTENTKKYTKGDNYPSLEGEKIILEMLGFIEPKCFDSIFTIHAKTSYGKQYIYHIPEKKYAKITKTYTEIETTYQKICCEWKAEPTVRNTNLLELDNNSLIFHNHFYNVLKKHKWLLLLKNSL